MRRLSRLLLAVIFAALTHGQDPVFRTDTRLVVLHASVVDRAGKLVTHLPQKAFKVYENGVEQQIRIFRREDVPVALGLVIDNSGSMKPRREQVESAALGLAKASNPEDRVFIVNFNDEAYLDVPFTSSIAKLEEGLARIDARGGTAMRDAISMSLDYMRDEAKLDKRVLLVITDGDDNASSVTLEQVVRRAQQSEILIYAIGLLSDEDRGAARRAQRAMTAISEASGGLAFFPKDLQEVNQLALDVAHEIRNQYIIAYSPANQAMDGSYRQIRVTVEGPNRPVARTRTGYYATPEPRQRAAAAMSPTARQ
ncbi:MAG TPA: VWA domain-containing protein [Bryobacteraceae bacterium]|nr:VWA domain-containing protein [Bryobacteraceae bacterium]